MTWTPRKSKRPWRDFLTPDEKGIIEKAESAKLKWLELNKGRHGIANRAGRRAIYDATKHNRERSQDLREFLTVEENSDLVRLKLQKKQWRKLNKERNKIVNRANMRAAYKANRGKKNQRNN